MALLHSGYFKEKTTMFTLKKFMPAGAIALVAVIAVIGVASLTGKPSQASAQEIAKKSYQTVANLPAGEQAKVSASLGMDSRTALQEAYDAKDLQALTYDEFVASGPVPLDGKDPGRLSTLKFLQYTNASEQIVTLGIDPQTNLPVYVDVRIENANPAGGSEEKGFQTSTRTDKGLVNCTIENGVENCTEVSE